MHDMLNAKMCIFFHFYRRTYKSIFVNITTLNITLITKELQDNSLSNNQAKG
jgi:hypothetical protein